MTNTTLIAALTLSALVPAAVPAEQACDTSLYPLSAPTDRYEDHGDGTVTDRQTMLMWMRCSAGQAWVDGTCRGEPSRLTLAQANEYADRVNDGGEYFFNDWRVPRLPELAALVERQCAAPRINLAVFPATPADAYWSTTARPGGDAGGFIYALGFGNDGVQRRRPEEAHHVRLVRNAP